MEARDPGETFICFVLKSNFNLTNKLNSSNCFEDLSSKLFDDSYYEKLPSKLRNKLFCSSLMITMHYFFGKAKRFALR